MKRNGRGGDGAADWRQYARRLVDWHLRQDRRVLWSLATVIVCAVAVTIVPARADSSNATPTAMIDIPLALPAAAPTTRRPPAPAQAKWKSVTVETGQTLSGIFASLDLDYADLSRVIAKPETARAMRNLHPGDELGFRINANGTLEAMRFNRDDQTRVVLTLNDDHSVGEHVVKRHIERRVHLAQGSIDSSLFAAANDAGMSPAMVIKLANVFRFDIDFIKDIRDGDRFTVIYDDIWSTGERLGPGRIIAAEFFNRGERFTAYRFVKPDGDVGYYTEDGRPLRKTLLRTPVKFSRISSRFSKKRKHPILGYTRAHEGVDYASPKGTPIHAAGDGTISVRGWVHGYGRYIRVKNTAKYSTVYAHMSRYAPGLHVGSHVEQGQVIGYVGESGLATGPHLHYEVRIHGHPVNPLTVTLPKPEPLPQKLLAQFKSSIAPKMAQLQRLDRNHAVLLASHTGATSTAGSD